MDINIDLTITGVPDKATAKIAADFAPDTY